MRLRWFFKLLARPIVVIINHWKRTKQRPRPRTLDSNEQRRTLLLEILQTMPGASTSELHSALKLGFCQKTIQRDLRALVLQGAITKTGEKRWTRYFPTPKN